MTRYEPKSRKVRRRRQRCRHCHFDRSLLSLSFWLVIIVCYYCPCYYYVVAVVVVVVVGVVIVVVVVVIVIFVVFALND